ncbi:hypothetical protein [Halorubrum sp. Atlit-28R]|uniref:hypothetical protein n=1 Tax=Halorubrum sp. Atlit-28R TaxID=2282129 RepID=UPI000EF24663|nr:hypothetical protein [Halorubrum sp. Atlit-28R]RLM52195.1 hypothetical protein DVK06_01475 [Halorubrum sp. Atlit-28R]
MPSTSPTWFHGYVDWYVRGVIWFVQSALVGVVLLAVLGTGGLSGVVSTASTGLITALLLIRQVDKHIRQEMK